MSLGGGTFTTQNKKLPGAYMNFASVMNADASLSDRGYAAMGLVLDWGIDGAIFTVTGDDFKKNSLKLFGYDYLHPKLKGLRELFINVSTLYAYKLNSAGSKAENDYAVAKCGGIRGNDLKIVFQKNIDDESKFDVSTYLGLNKVDTQTVSTVSELTANDYVIFKTETALAETAATPLTGGTNGNDVTAADHQAFLDKAESYSFNAIGVVSEDSSINKLYSEFAKRMRDDKGIKFQSVTWHNAADSEGNVNVKNEVIEDGFSKAGLCYWVTGIIASCEVNKSNTNRIYDGELQVKADLTQAELESCIDAGEFVLHQVGSSVRVLLDINSLTTVTEEKGEVFKDNQTIRVIDVIANDIAALFNERYLGVVPNDKSGQVSLWTDIVKIFNNLMTIRAIENFSPDDIVVEQGNSKKSVVVISACNIVNAMAQLYMTTTVQ